MFGSQNPLGWNGPKHLALFFSWEARARFNLARQGMLGDGPKKWNFSKSGPNTARLNGQRLELGDCGSTVSQLFAQNRLVRKKLFAIMLIAETGWDQNQTSSCRCLLKILDSWMFHWPCPSGLISRTRSWPPKASLLGSWPHWERHGMPAWGLPIHERLAKSFWVKFLPKTSKPFLGHKLAKLFQVVPSCSKWSQPKPQVTAAFHHFLGGTSTIKHRGLSRAPKGLPIRHTGDVIQRFSRLHMTGLLHEAFWTSCKKTSWDQKTDV